MSNTQHGGQESNIVGMRKKINAQAAHIQKLEARIHSLRLGDQVHLNSAGDLPPVACPIVIELPGQGLKRAERTGFVAHKDNQMEYALADGSKIIGRFRWTYP